MHEILLHAKLKEVAKPVPIIHVPRNTSGAEFTRLMCELRQKYDEMRVRFTDDMQVRETFEIVELI